MSQTITSVRTSTPASPTTPASGTTVNGIDVAVLRGAIDAVAQQPSKGMTTWRIRSQWVGGTRTDHHVEGFGIGGEQVARPFTLRVDEPHELWGTNQYANPQEYLLAGLNACMMVGYSAVAAIMGIHLQKLEVETTGDIDLRGFLGIDSSVPPGYTDLRQSVRIAADASPEQLQKLHATVQRTSPNFHNITRAIPTTSTLVIDPARS